MSRGTRTPNRRTPMTRSSRTMSGVSSVARSAREGTGPIAPRLAVAGVLGAVIIGILVLRLWAITVLGGAEYAERADQNQIRRLPVPAPRGNILDRNGLQIVVNREKREVVLDLQDVEGPRRDQVIERLGALLADSGAEIEERTEEIREAVDNAPPGAIEPVVVERDLVRDEVVHYLAEHRAEFPGVDVKRVFARTYPEGSTAAHVLGQVGQVSPEDLEENKSLQPGDVLGKSGIERTYDEYIRGVNGYDAVQVDASGVRTDASGVRGLPFTAGRNLRLTIDLRLQKASERVLHNAIRKAAGTAKGRDASAGAVVAIAPKTGEVLTMASLPSYDPDVFTSPLPKDQRLVKRLIDPENPREPLLDRAIQGAYPPGSTYKAITALAALDKNYVTPDTLIDCPPALEISHRIFKNHDTSGLGHIPLKTALETSCDTYFYVLATQFYSDPKSPLQDWTRRFGLGKPTGIDVAGEAAGVVPDPEWKSKQTQLAKTDRAWRPGDSVNLSIGQGDLLSTPLQMTNVYATLANGGTLNTPRLGLKVQTTGGRDQVVLPPGSSRDLKINPADLEAVIEGLELVNVGGRGTATGAFGDFPISSAGKSGTSEKFGQTDLAWYCGFAPVENPEIAACAFVDGGGGGGSVAAPIVRRMFDQWFGPNGSSAVKLDSTPRSAVEDAAAVAAGVTP